jgi:hypothetical protein
MYSSEKEHIEMDIDTYQAPAVEDLGSLTELTLGGGGADTDMCGGVHMSASGFGGQP